MDWSDWISGQYVQWRGNAIGRERTINEFAAWVGVSQSLMSQWMKKGGKRPTSQKTISQLVKRFGLEVYDVLGYPRTLKETPQDQLPPALRDRLNRAIAEVNDSLKRLGLAGDSGEAEKIAIEIFEKYGFKYTATTIDESTSLK